MSAEQKKAAALAQMAKEGLIGMADCDVGSLRPST